MRAVPTEAPNGLNPARSRGPSPALRGPSPGGRGAIRDEREPGGLTLIGGLASILREDYAKSSFLDPEEMAEK